MSEAVPAASAGRRLHRWAGALALLLLLFGWFVWIDVRLLYHRPRPVFPSFLMTRSFIFDFLSRPGGLVPCASAFLAQFFHYRVAGALILTSVCGLLALGVRLTLKAFDFPGPLALCLAPVFVVAAAHARYAHVLDLLLLMCTVAFTAGFLAWLGRKRSWVQLAASLIVAVPACYALGGGYAVLGATMVLGEAAGRRRWAAAAAWLVAGLALPYLMGTVWLRLTPQQAFRPLPFPPWSDDAAALAGWMLAASLPGAVLVGAVLRAMPGTGAEAREGRPRAGAGWVVGGVLLLIGAVVLVVATDRLTRRRLRIELLSHEGRWAELLAEAEGLSVRTNTLLSSISVNRALYHAGRLSRDLLAYPQFKYGLLRSPEEFFHPQEPRMPHPRPSAFMRMSDIFFELGRVNEAEHMASEAMEDQGYRPWILERIGLARVAKGEWESGRSFLAALSHDPVFGERGRAYLSMMESDPVLAAVPEVARVRSQMSLVDTAGPLTIETHLQLLLERDPANRMAMEYLMTHYLLTGELEGFVAHLGPAVALGDGEVPDLYQEALLMYAGQVEGGAQLAKRLVTPRVRARFGQFRRIIERHAGDRRAALLALAGEFRESYLPYYTFFIMEEGR